jgi:AcrR family transcriptional regulator
MIPDRALRIDPAVRDRLFAVASEAFVQHGYERASLNAILAAAGMGKSSFFYYFVDKEDLFASVLEAALSRIAANVGPADLPTDPSRFWDEAAAAVGRWGAAMDAEQDFVGLLRALQPMRRGACSRLLRVMDEARRVYRALLTRGVELGAVRDDLDIDTMMALIDAVDLALDEAFHRDSALATGDVEAHRVRMVDLVRRLIAHEKHP